MSAEYFNRFPFSGQTPIPSQSFSKTSRCTLTYGDHPVKPIELSKQQRADAIASIQRYFEENLSEPIGDLPAGLFLNYLLEEIGPAIHNQAVAEAQSHLQLQLSDLTANLYADEFQYWPKADAKRKSRR